MSTAKVIFRESKVTKNGEVPIWLRIIKDRKPKFIALGIKVKPKDWDYKNNRVKKSHTNSQRINNLISHKLAEAEGVLLELETSPQYTSPKRAKDAVMGRCSVSFIEYAEKNIKRLENEGKIGTMLTYKASLKKLKWFIKGRDLIFDELTVPFIKDFHDYLRIKLSNGVNTTHSMLKDIRKLCYDAERDDILKMDKNPFRRYKLVTEYSEKSFLTEDELQQVADLIIDPRKMKYHSRNMYVFACYTGGIRISDLLQLSFNNYDGERLLIKTQKTDSMLSILVPDIARKIIDLYINDNTQANDYIFPFLKKDIDYSDPTVFHKAISSANAFINSHLKEIAKTLKFDKKMNFHTSRHTFATRALRKGMRIEYVSRLMTHTNITTTQIYAKIVNAELDTAMNIFNQ